MRKRRPEHPTLAAVVREALGVSWGEARKLCATGKVAIGGVVCVDPARRVEEPATVTVDREAPRVRKGALPPERWVHSDEHLVVVNKPPGVLSVPHAGEKNTLLDRVRAPLGRGRGKKGRGKRPYVGVVHRIDKGTSGLLVFARSEEAQQALKALFARHAIERGYVALAHGAVDTGTHTSWLLRDRRDGYRGSWTGSGEPPAEAKRAVTHVRASRRLKGASLVELALETGRTHQIRIHLAEAGHPLLGEPVYIGDYEGKWVQAPRAMLHAFRLGFVHPITREKLSFERPPPGDFLAALNARGGSDWRP